MNWLWQAMDWYGDWLGAPEQFGRCMWRLVWSVALFALIPAFIIGVMTALS